VKAAIARDSEARLGASMVACPNTAAEDQNWRIDVASDCSEETHSSGSERAGLASRSSVADAGCVEGNPSAVGCAAMVDARSHRIPRVMARASLHRQSARGADARAGRRRVDPQSDHSHSDRESRLKQAADAPTVADSSAVLPSALALTPRRRSQSRSVGAKGAVVARFLLASHSDSAVAASVGC
jgi:hypothetical protein